jgi:MFS family permease
VVGGLFISGYSVSTFNAMLSVCPADKRPTYIALYTTLINVTAFLAPLAGSGLASWLGARTALYLSGAARVVGWASLVWFLLRTTPRRRRRTPAERPARTHG